MRCRVRFVVLAVAVVATAGRPVISASPSALHTQAGAQSRPGPGNPLEHLTWPDAERVPQAVPPDGASGYVSVGGARLFYQVRGAGPWLLLLHGGLSSSAEFDAIIPELARQYRVLAIDRRGHGRSSDSAAPFAYATMAAEVKAVADALGVPSAAVLGFSDGGVVAFILEFLK